MPRFIVIGHDAPADADFGLDDLPGAGRLDLLCRSVNAALLLSHGVRDDASIALVLQDAATVSIDGGEIGGLNPDERSIAGLIRKALLRLEGRGNLPDGVRVSPGGLAEQLEAADAPIIQLHPAGEPITDAEPPDDAVFVLSDHRELSGAEQETVAAARDGRVRVGPRPLHTDHAITAVHNYLDTAGYSAY